jgi:hypothetical protein
MYDGSRAQMGLIDEKHKGKMFRVLVFYYFITHLFICMYIYIHQYKLRIYIVSL